MKRWVSMKAHRSRKSPSKGSPTKPPVDKETREEEPTGGENLKERRSSLRKSDTEKWEARLSRMYGRLINARLRERRERGEVPLVRDLCADLKNGVVLFHLLEVLSGAEVKTRGLRLVPTATLKIQAISNLNLSFAALQDLGVRFVNVSPNDVYDGNAKRILGLLWTTLLFFALRESTRIEGRFLAGESAAREKQDDTTRTVVARSPMSFFGDAPLSPLKATPQSPATFRRPPTSSSLKALKVGLAGWASSVTGEHVPSDGLVAAFKDGRLFCELLASIDAGAAYDPARSPRENAKRIFDRAEAKMGVPVLIDVDAGDPLDDEQSLVAYLCELKHAFDRRAGLWDDAGDDDDDDERDGDGHSAATQKIGGDDLRGSAAVDIDVEVEREDAFDADDVVVDDLTGGAGGGGGTKKKKKAISQRKESHPPKTPPRHIPSNAMSVEDDAEGHEFDDDDPRSPSRRNNSPEKQQTQRKSPLLQQRPADQASDAVPSPNSAVPSPNSDYSPYVADADRAATITSPTHAAKSILRPSGIGAVLFGRKKKTHAYPPPIELAPDSPDSGAVVEFSKVASPAAAGDVATPSAGESATAGPTQHIIEEGKKTRIRVGVGVHRARGLLGGRSINPYCVVQYDDAESKSAKVDATADPAWHHTALFDVDLPIVDEKRARVTVYLFSANTLMADSLLGKVELMLYGLLDMAEPDDDPYGFSDDEAAGMGGLGDDTLDDDDLDLKNPRASGSRRDAADASRQSLPEAPASSVAASPGSYLERPRCLMKPSFLAVTPCDTTEQDSISSSSGSAARARKLNVFHDTRYLFKNSGWLGAVELSVFSMGKHSESP